MPLDGSVIAAVRKELEPLLTDSRIDKVYQPEPDELVLLIRHQRHNVKLLLSAHNQYPRIQLTDTSKPNPSQPPVFCMLLRKHLAGGRITGIEQPDFERMLVLHIQGQDELNQLTHKKLIIEMMGKHSNIILVDGRTNLIHDAIKRVPLHISRKRQVLPGLSYDHPPSEKQTPLAVDTEEKIRRVMDQHHQQSLKNAIIHSFNGFSPLMANEVIHRSSLDAEQRWNEIREPEKSQFCQAFHHFCRLLINEVFEPVIIADPQTGKYIDFSVLPMTHLEGMKTIVCPTPSAMLESFYSQKDHSDRLQQRSQDLRKILAVKRNRLSHKLQNLQHDEEKALRSSEDKRTADLIMANIHLARPGDDSITVIDYFDETQPEIQISLDPHKTASQRAQSLYKRYRKSKTALIEIERQRRKSLMEIQYLDQIIHSIDQAETLQDLDMIREELTEAGFLKKKNTRQKKRMTPEQNAPLTFVSSGNRLIRVGKNNIQNEMVTFRIGKKSDLWFHVKDLPGSHVVLILNNQQPAKGEIREAALLAAYFSKARHGSKVPVDYTWCRHVKKQRNAHPGMVIYDNHQTIYVTPLEEEMKKLLPKQQ